MILDAKPQLLEHPADTRRPQGGRPHQRAALRSADVDGNTEQGDTGLFDIGFSRRERA